MTTKDDDIQAKLDAARAGLPSQGIPASLRICATDEGVEMTLGGKTYLFDAETADGMSAALRQCALEHRNGGALS